MAWREAPARLLLLVGFALVGCDHLEIVERAQAAPPRDAGGARMPTWDRLIAFAGEGASATRLDTVKAPGFDVYLLARKGGRSRYGGAAVPLEDGPILEGKPALPVLFKLVTAPDQLATLSLAFLESGGQPVLRPADIEAPDLDVHPPRVSGRVLEYWSKDRPNGPPTLQRSLLDLDSLVLEVVSEETLRAAATDPVEQARRWLAEAATTQHRLALEQLAEHCADPRATGLIASTLRTHASAEARTQAAQLLGTCHGPDALEALQQALVSDASPDARSFAAASLAQAFGARARPILEAALASEKDPAVRGTIARTAKYLPAP